MEPTYTNFRKNNKFYCVGMLCLSSSPNRIWQCLSIPKFSSRPMRLYGRMCGQCNVTPLELKTYFMHQQCKVANKTPSSSSRKLVVGILQLIRQQGLVLPQNDLVRMAHSKNDDSDVRKKHLRL